MKFATLRIQQDDAKPSVIGPAGPFDRPVLEAAIAQACERIAPLWPLGSFVAVNPFLAFSGQSFAATCAAMRRVNGVDMLMPRRFYREAMAAGIVEEGDLRDALRSVPASWRVPSSAAALRDAAAHDPFSMPKTGAVVATVAEILDRLALAKRQSSRTTFMIDEIAKWCAAYFDQGQAVWRLPSQGLGLYAAWRDSMRHDRNPEIMGIRGFRAAVASMPDDPVDAIAATVAALGIPERALVDYLHRALFDIGGWAAYVRHLVWTNALNGRSDDSLVNCSRSARSGATPCSWKERMRPSSKPGSRPMAAAAEMPQNDDPAEDPDLALDLVLHDAYEAAYRRRLQTSLATGANTEKSVARRRLVQAAFCIDVRSEVYRRAFETVCPEAETIGFAGFFGVPIEYVPIGSADGDAQCPVLLKPSFVICESLEGADRQTQQAVAARLSLRRRAAKAFASFKKSAVSSFTFVETLGLLFAGNIVRDSLGLSPATGSASGRVGNASASRVRPSLEPGVTGGRTVGMTAEQRTAAAAGLLRGMSLTEGFARLVIFAGHGSTTVNNPHGSGLDCGACGGHTGEANARVAAAILNDPEVRRGLKLQGIDIPSDTWFLACLHDTTTDDIRLLDIDSVPKSHSFDVARLRGWFGIASHLARAERSWSLKIPENPKTDRAIRARSRDWSQVRPEWGLAGNAAFIAAPRARTAGINLRGQAFLHSYDWQRDPDFKVLELIMTAPMVVASWINLQYYGSAVNNRAFGAGNKVLHNVTGTVGVLEGNAGDLRAGLPWQSVHDGRQLVHKPLRLNVFIAAPLDALNGVIAAHQGVRDLVDNQWIHLFAIADSGPVSHRYCGNLTWEKLS